MKLSEICEYTTKRIETKSLGVDNYISTENMLQNKGGVVAAAKVPAEKAVAFNPGDILISNIRPYFKKIWHADKRGGCSSDVLCLRALPGIDKTYLYYLLSQDSFFEYVMSGAKGSKMPRGDKAQIMNWEVSIPDFAEQRRIGAFLKSIDDKIALNTHINHNLEEQSLALYKSWFIDFKPFKDEAFVDSEKGMVPKGWRVKRLGDLCTCVLGGTPSRNHPEYWGGSFGWINSGAVNEFRITEPSEFITDKGLRSSATKLLPANTVVIAITGATLGQYSILSISSCANQSVIGILENTKIPTEYIYPFIAFSIDDLLLSATGGAQQHINKNNVENLNILIPPEAIMKAYSAVAKIMFDEITIRSLENKKLCIARDSLLPRLLSSE